MVEPATKAGSRFDELRKSLPPLPFLIGGVIIVILIIAFEMSGGPEGAQRLCEQILHDLGQLQPFGLIGTYFSGVECSNWNSQFECALGSVVDVMNPSHGIGRLFSTLGEAWSVSGVPGRIIFTLALLTAIPIAYAILAVIAARVFKSRNDEFSVPLLVVSLVLAPFIASALALILQLLGIALFTVLGDVLGLIIWTLTTFGGLMVTWKYCREALEWGHRLHHAAGMLKK
jgi:hypothetical protein